MDQRALAIESYDLGLSELNAHRGDELARSAQYWNRGPSDMEWCSLPRHREPAALIVDALAWMAPDDRGPRVRALFARFRRIDEHAPIGTAGAATEHVPIVSHPAWLARMPS